MPIKREYNKDFFKTWSPEMAFVLGFLFADGNIVLTNRGTHFVSLYTADEALIMSIQKTLASSHKVAARKSETGVVYRLQIGSKVWFDDLQKLGLTPNKSARMRFPYLPKKYIGDFVRGYFDGDGNVWSGTIHKQRKTSHTTLQLAFTSASHYFLEGLLDLLHQIGVKGGSIRKSKLGEYSRLSFGAADALTIYKIMYNGPHKLYLPRKKQVFEKFVNCGGSSTG